MNFTNKITYFNFDRKRFIKSFKKNTSTYIILSKLYKTNNEKLGELNLKRITNLLNSLLQRKEIFDNGNIIVILNKVADYFKFLEDFTDSIKTTENVESLRDRHICYFTTGGDFEKFLNSNFSKPINIFK